eukprot:TRINITY_DN5528_c0_g1_i4.p1 TRINITY_DN5528_c0_g1~~TRINITY_DN5528_c0_g1_i4.p1  ORF type:complete len:137 (-),score=43.33 TRINITY_DN5528_c0_g1_i4:125-490(-)
MATPHPLQQKLEEEVNEWQNIQREIEKQDTNKHKIVTQLKENEMVKKELDLLDTDATIFKLIGPALIKQDPDDAKTTVAKRIEYLSSEVKRIEEVVKEHERKMAEKKQVIIEMQNKLRAGR